MAQRTREDDATGEDSTFDPEEETVTEAWEGAFIYTSWGYGQTNVNMAQITEVSDSGKTVLARLVAKECVESEKGSDSMRPSADQYGDEFRLHVRAGSKASKPSFRGSYPFLDGDMDEGTRRDSFLPFGNDEGNTVHQTSANHGH